MCGGWIGGERSHRDSLRRHPKDAVVPLGTLCHSSFDSQSPEHLSCLGPPRACIQLFLVLSDRGLVSLGIGSPGAWAFKNSRPASLSILAPALLLFVLYRLCSPPLWELAMVSGIPASCPALCRGTFIPTPPSSSPMSSCWPRVDAQ